MKKRKIKPRHVGKHPALAAPYGGQREGWARSCVSKPEDRHAIMTATEMVRPVDETNPKDRLGDAKPQVHLIPAAAMSTVARVMELGARKYGPYNWRSKKVRMLVYAGAALRHIYSYISGETHDSESGQSHLAHAAACMLIALDAEATGNAIDDRSWPTDVSKQQEADKALLVNQVLNR